MSDGLIKEKDRVAIDSVLAKKSQPVKLANSVDPMVSQDDPSVKNNFTQESGEYSDSDRAYLAGKVGATYEAGSAEERAAYAAGRKAAGEQETSRIKVKKPSIKMK